ncbi:MAG: glycosyltransferase family 2 protein [Candidatus Sumerlaeaceae bacterium]|nr:glycosyltransferase family 2 protein [Candidatus Sumerlaeaceae bacterium]
MENAQPVDVSIVLPAFNEQDAIAKVIDDVRAAMATAPQWRYEILVVDDCSTDATAERAQACGVRVVRHRQNSGSGAARRTGILEARGEIIVMLDADGTYHAASIPEMLRYFPDYDQVNGARTSEQGTLKPLRIGAKWFIRKLAEYLAGREIPDLNTGLKAFKRSVMLKYLWVLPEGFSCVTTMTLAFLTNGHPVKYVATPYYKRIGKSKFHPVSDTANYLQTVVRMVTYFRPLRVFGPAALLLLLTGFVTSVYHVIRRGKPSLEESDIILLCTGIIVGAVGLLADLMVAQRRG